MTPDRYKAALSNLGLTQIEAGSFTGRSSSTSVRWATIGPPPEVALLLYLMEAMKLTPAEVDSIVKRHLA